MRELHILFDGPPSHESGRFVEVNDETGKSVNAGEWVELPDGLWALVITEHAWDMGRQPAPERGGAETYTQEDLDRAEAKAAQIIADIPVDKRQPVLAAPPDPEGWIAWSGGECPVAPETLVDVIVRVDHQRDRREAGTWHWNLNPVDGQITAYRVRPATGKGG